MAFLFHSRSGKTLQAVITINKEGCTFHVDAKHTEAFETLKLKITNDCLLQFFDPKLPVYIETDASKQGLRVVLLKPESTVRK